MNIEQIIGWAYSYACNLVDKGIDIRTIEAPTMLDKAKKDIMDNRPLTDDTLKELGFELTEDSTKFKGYIKNDGISPNNYTIKIVGKMDGTKHNFLYIMGNLKIETVGSVIMLIEALKGDE